MDSTQNGLDLKISETSLQVLSLDERKISVANKKIQAFVKILKQDDPWCIVNNQGSCTRYFSILLVNQLKKITFLASLDDEALDNTLMQ